MIVGNSASPIQFSNIVNPLAISSVYTGTPGPQAITVMQTYTVPTARKFLCEFLGAYYMRATGTTPGGIQQAAQTMVRSGGSGKDVIHIESIEAANGVPRAGINGASIDMMAGDAMKSQYGDASGDGTTRVYLPIHGLEADA